MSHTSKRRASSTYAAVVTKRIHAASSRVWETMAKPGSLVLYHPFCVDNPVDTWPGVGAKDAVHYLSGVILHRRFTAWEEGRGYELKIGNAKWPASRVRWTLDEVGANESQLTISVRPSAFLKYPEILRWAVYRLYLLPLLRRYLTSVLKGLNYYITTDRKVAPNQFGRVVLFSYSPSKTN